MKTAVKVFAIAGICVGTLGFFLGIGSDTLASLVAGCWWVGWGICDLVLLKNLSAGKSL